MKTRTFLSLIIAASVIVSLSSCSSNETMSVSPELNERIDMTIYGADEEHIFMDGSDAHAGTLVDFSQNVYSGEVSFILNLDDARRLVFKVTDRTNAEPWRIAGKSYSIYPTAEMEDKNQWVTSEMKNLHGEILALSNLGNVCPRGTYLNAFNIQSFNANTNEVLCRLDGFIMMDALTGQDVTINGTFRGVVDFAS